MNAPTARFFSVLAALEYSEDAAEMAYGLLVAPSQNNFGRDRRKAAIEVVAPQLSALLA